MENLSAEFWNNRYDTGQIGWDLGAPSTPLKTYFDQLVDKDLKILIPGAGNAYEAEYLHQLGFINVYVVDIAANAINSFHNRYPSFPQEQLIHADFFELEGSFDLIIEQTFFCAIDPKLRQAYVRKVHELLADNGKLIGLLFDKHFEGGPPFGGSTVEYQQLFTPVFKKVVISPCYNSIQPRQGAEAFIKMIK